jgi:hypothetical protein
MSKTINCDEITLAIKGLAPGKAPGLDGISIDFYKKFEDLITPKLLELYKQSYKQTILPSSTRSSVIIIIIIIIGAEAKQCPAPGWPCFLTLFHTSFFASHSHLTHISFVLFASKHITVLVIHPDKTLLVCILPSLHTDSLSMLPCLSLSSA